MSADEKLTKTLEAYQSVAKEVPNVDVAALMINALANEKQNIVSSKAKKWAYLVSIGLPPLGLLFAAKYYFFGEEDDAKTVAYVCIFLTIIAGLMFWATAKLLFSSSGTSVQQIEQIKPGDINQILQ